LQISDSISVTLFDKSPDISDPSHRESAKMDSLVFFLAQAIRPRHLLPTETKPTKEG